MSLTLLKCKRLVDGVKLMDEARILGLSTSTLHRLESRQLPFNKIRPDWREAVEGRHGLKLEELLKYVSV